MARIRWAAWLLAISSALAGTAWAAAPLPKLSVSNNGHYLIDPDGKAFFYLGDTAWELFHRLGKEEAELYLKNRASKGFNVVQAVVLAEYGGLNVPNAEGAVPLEDNDPTKPVEKYFQHVDWVVDKANELGIYVGMLPTWGDKWNKAWGQGPEIFSPENARRYGEFLGKRYRDRGVIWILGGDRNVDNDRQRQIIEAMAAGLTAGDQGAHLITYHPSGGNSSLNQFPDAPWLSFHMFQSGHGHAVEPNYKLVAAAYDHLPAKPVIDGEPNYEDHPIGFKAENDYFGDAQVRRAAYWAVLAGAAGHTYGNHNIWQFYEPGRDPVTAARTPWKVAVDHPGAEQMLSMKKLFEARPFEKLVPGQDLLESGTEEGPNHVQAARAADDSFIIAYAPAGRDIHFKVSPLLSKRWRMEVFLPRSGRAGEERTVESIEGFSQMAPPGEDWVLVLTNPDAGLSPLRPPVRRAGR